MLAITLGPKIYLMLQRQIGFQCLKGTSQTQLLMLVITS